MNDQEFEYLELTYERNQFLAAHTCLHCEQTMFFNPVISAPPVLGQVYSEAGLREVSISGLCETCFDDVTIPPDESVFSDYDERDNSHEIREDSWNDAAVDQFTPDPGSTDSSDSPSSDRLAGPFNDATVGRFFDLIDDLVPDEGDDRL